MSVPGQKYYVEYPTPAVSAPYPSPAIAYGPYFSFENINQAGSGTGFRGGIGFSLNVGGHFSGTQ